MKNMNIKEYEGPDQFLKPQDYRMALESQSACNLSGIVHWLSVIVNKVWDEANQRKKGTDWVNQHPICRLLAEQVAHLSGAGSCSSSSYCEASDYCEARSKA